MNKAGSKRKSDASAIAVPAKRSANVLVPEEVLRTMVSSLNAATLALMELPCRDVAARGRAVAVVADCKRQMNNILGIKRRGISVLAVSDTIIDVFQFLRRKELDTLQLLCKRFNAIVVKKLTMVCLRLLWSAKLSHSGVQRQFVLLMGEVGAKKLTRLPTGVDDEPAATTLLLNACRSSRVESLELYGTGALSVEFFDSLALSAPTISLKDLRFGNRTVPDDIPHDRVLRALRSFAELKRAMIVADRKDAILQNCLIRTCFKIGVSLVSNVPVPRDVTFGKCDIAVVEEALLEFSFGVCDDQYAMRERSLYVCFYKKTLKNDFLQRWIEKAEVTDCRHNLTLDIRSGVLLQDTDALQAYKQGGLAELNLRFRSVSGRRWAVTYGNGKIVFEIKH